MSKKRKDNNGNVVSLATSKSMDIGGINASEKTGRAQECNDHVAARLIELDEAVKKLMVSADLILHDYQFTDSIF